MVTHQPNRSNPASPLSLLHLLPVLILLATLLGGCAGAPTEHRPVAESGFGQLVLYLNVPPSTETEVSFEVVAIEAKGPEGSWQRLMTGPFRVDSEEMRGRQVLLAEKTLSAGAYTDLRLSVQGGSLKRKGKPATLAQPEGGYVDYPFAFRIRPGQATQLLINWYPAESVAEGYLLRPALSPQAQQRATSALEVYATNEGSNSVSVIDRQNYEVSRTIQVGSAPKGIAFGRFEARTKIFVANSGDNTVSVIDPVANQVEQTIPLQFGQQPEDVAVYAAGMRGGAVYVSNYGSQNVSIVDPLLLREVDRVQVGRGPVALAIDPALESITGSAGLSFADLNLWRGYRQSYFNVYCANELSNTVTVIVCRVSDGHPERTVDLKVEFSPRGLTVDPVRAKVYVANSGSNNLSVIDIIQVIRGRTDDAVTTISNVGINGVAVAPDPFFERIYLLRSLPAEIDFIQTASGALRGISTPVLGIARVDASPRRLVMDPEGRKLWVTCQETGTVNVIDKTSRRVEGSIQVGRRPYGLTIIP